jgi:DNA-binding MarR family transcriptional regulator
MDVSSRTRKSRTRNGKNGTVIIAHLRRIVRAIQEQSATIEAAVGLTGPQLWALREINASVRGLSLGEIAKRLCLHKASAGRIAERLLQRGLIQADRPENDKRYVVVRVTKAGRVLAERPVAGPAQASLLSRLDNLDRDETEHLEATLSRLVQLLGAESIEPGPLFDESSERKRRSSRRRGG